MNQIERVERAACREAGSDSACRPREVEATSSLVLIADDDAENDRPTIPPPFSMEAFAWDMTAPESELPIDVDLDDALAGWDDLASPAPSTIDRGRPPFSSHIERAVVGLPEDSHPSAMSRHEFEDPSAYVLERYRAGDYAAALDMADVVLLTETPGNQLVQACRDRCRDALAKVYAQKLGPLDRIPVVVALAGPSDPLPVDHRTRFLLSLIDGTSNLSAVIGECGMPRLDALRLLHELALRRVIGFK